MSPRTMLSVFLLPILFMIGAGPLAFATIDESCSRSQNGINERALLEQAVERAKFRSDTCFRGWKLPSTEDVSAILDQATISCEDLPENTGARNYNTQYHFGVAPFILTNSAHSRNFRISVSRRELSTVGAEDLANYLIHEALHSLPTKNRLWHDTWSETNHTLGCTNSIYLDRVYLIAAACTPLSNHGRRLYESVFDEKAACHDVCIRALTEIDDMSSLEQAQSTFSFRGIAGPPLFARPNSRREAEIFCSRIKQGAQAHRARTPQNPLVSAIFGSTSRFLP